MNSKQIAGFLFGLFSIIIPYAAFFVGLLKSVGFLLVCVGVAFVMGLIGLILSASSISQAREQGYSKGLSIAGIITSVIGMLTCVGMGIAFGGTILLVNSLYNK